MREKLSTFFIRVAGMLELVLAFIVVCAISISAIDLFRELVVSVIHYIKTGSAIFEFKLFLSIAIQIIIGIEFVKMLSNHSPASAIEVVLFVIAKRIIVDESRSFEVLLGVVALALLFVVRKYLLTAHSRLDEDKGVTPIDETEQK